MDVSYQNRKIRCPNESASNEKLMLKKIIVSGAAKALMAFSMFFLTMLVTRTLSDSESGLFLLAISILSAASIFFRLGLDNVVLRKISANKGEVNSQAALATGVQWIIVASLPVALLIFIFAEEISVRLLSKPEFSPVLEAAIWALPVMSVFMLIAMGFQAFHRVVATTFFQNLGVSLLFLIGFGVMWYVSPEALTAASAAKIYTAAAIAILVIAIVLWHRQVKGDWGKLKFKDAELWSASSNLWLASSMTLAVQWAGILVAGAYVAASEIAYLSAAQRTANLTSFVLMVVNMVVAPRYARLWHEGKKGEMNKLAKWSTRGMLALAVAHFL